MRTTFAEIGIGDVEAATKAKEIAEQRLAVIEKEVVRGRLIVKPSQNSHTYAFWSSPASALVRSDLFLGHDQEFRDIEQAADFFIDLEAQEATDAKA